MVKEADTAVGTRRAREQFLAAGALSADAVAPGDYTAGNSTLTIPAGSTTGQISVATVNDGDQENAEAFTVTLSSPTNADIAGGGGGTGIGTISASD